MADFHEVTNQRNGFEIENSKEKNELSASFSSRSPLIAVANFMKNVPQPHGDRVRLQPFHLQFKNEKLISEISTFCSTSGTNFIRFS